MCFPFLFIQTIVDISRSKSKGQKRFLPMYIYGILRFLGLFEFPPLELIHITAPIGATFLRQRQTQIKSVIPSTGTSKRSRGEASTTAPASGVITAAVDPFGGAEDVDPMVTPPLSLCGMMQSFMTTQAAHGQLFDELLMEVAFLRVDFVEYRSAFPPPPSSED